LKKVRRQNAINDGPEMDKEDGNHEDPFPPPENIHEIDWFHIGA
jgi:hypothetical protein